MRSRFHNLFFITTTLLLSVTSPLSAITPNFKPLVAQVQTVQERKAEAYQLLKEANSQFREGQLQESLQTFQQVRAIFREIGDREGEGNTLNYIGVVYANLGEFTKALEFHQQALAIHREIVRFSTIDGIISRASDIDIRGLRNLGNVYIKLGDYSRAIESLQQSLTIARTRRNRQAEKQALEDLGNAYGALGDYSKAIDYLNQSMALARAIGDKQGELKIVSLR